MSKMEMEDGCEFGFEVKDVKLCGGTQAKRLCPFCYRTIPRQVLPLQGEGLL